LRPGAGWNPPEAAVGVPLAAGDKGSLPPEEAGGDFLRPAREKSEPYGSRWGVMAPGLETPCSDDAPICKGRKGDAPVRIHPTDGSENPPSASPAGRLRSTKG